VTIAPIPTRHALIEGLRRLADWYDSDLTIPTPDDLVIGIRVADAAHVTHFAHIHGHAEPYPDRGFVCADAWFGPVVHRVYAPAGETR
jgi:hypothetical protein